MEALNNTPSGGFTANDAKFMNLALEQASRAQSMGEVPVGAVVVRDGKVIGVGSNAPISSQDPTAHAEVVALRAAAKYLGNYRLDGCRLYVTLEPCIMCAGAILHSRIDTVIYATNEAKTGAAGSAIDVFSVKDLNHQTKVFSGLLRDDASLLMRTFFQERRDVAREFAQPLRDDALRTPEGVFESLVEYFWPGNYNNMLTGLSGLRLHYLDLGPSEAPTTLFCIHDFPAWSYAFHEMLEVWIGAGMRVVVPDLIGFGKSDKPKRWNRYSVDFHPSYLAALALELKLNNVVLVGQGQGGDVAMAVARALNNTVNTCVTMPRCLFEPGQLGAENSRPLGPNHPYEIPFPDSGFRAAVKLTGFHGHGAANAAIKYEDGSIRGLTIKRASLDEETNGSVFEGDRRQRNISLAHKVLECLQEDKILL